MDKYLEWNLTVEVSCHKYSGFMQNCVRSVQLCVLNLPFVMGLLYFGVAIAGLCFALYFLFLVPKMLHC